MAHPPARRVFARPLALCIVLAGAALMSVAQPARSSAADGEEAAFLALINQYRAANGLNGLSLNNALSNSALWLSQDMAADNYFSHTDSLGRDPFARMSAFGYTYNTWRGENLAAGASSAQQAFDTWKRSPEHNANMLNPNYTVIGIGRAYRAGTAYGWYWATDFGGQADPAPPAQPASVVPPRPPPPPPAPAPVKPHPPVPPPPAPAPTPAPVPPATPTPAPAVARTDVPALNSSEIERQLRPWWNRLAVVGSTDSILQAASSVAATYLRFGDASGLRNERLLLGDPPSGRLWPAGIS